jgi:hypothetical protein
MNKWHLGHVGDDGGSNPVMALLLLLQRVQLRHVDAEMSENRYKKEKNPEAESSKKEVH